MTKLTRTILTITVALASAGTTVHAQPTLSAFAGVVAGAGTNSPGCTTFGSPSELSAFNTASSLISTGGIASCNYSGGYSTVNGTTGPVLNSASLSNVAIDLHGATFSGSANAKASYGSLGASATGTVTGGTGNPLSLYTGESAATFTDFLTATSPLVASLTNGFARYQFFVDGSLGALGTQTNVGAGTAYAELVISQNDASSSEILNALLFRGATPKITNTAPPAGWSSSVGSLSGGSTFFSALMPIQWGVAWKLKVGLLASALGTSESLFLSTAKITDVTLFDADQRPVNTFSLTSQSGTDYLRIGQTPPTTVPEPSTYVLMLAGLVAVGGVARTRRHRRISDVVDLSR